MDQTGRIQMKTQQRVVSAAILLIVTCLVTGATAGIVVEDDFDDGVVEAVLWTPFSSGAAYIEEADGVLKTSAEADEFGSCELDSRLELIGDFDVWVEYDWQDYYYSSSYSGGDARVQLRIWNTESTDLLALNCHRWALGSSREIIFSFRQGDDLVDRCWVTSERVPLSGKLRIRREGTTAHGYYWESDHWTQMCSLETFGTAAHVSLVGNNRSNNFPNAAFEVHWDNFHAEAYEIVGLESPPVADAGGPYLAAVGQTVLLDGSGSYDEDGDLLTYLWTQADNLGDIDDATDESPYYTASRAGITDLTLTVTDGQLHDSDTAMLVVYDPSGGFVTGGGWIWSLPGCYVLDPTLEGKANFGFVAKYKKGASEPMGNTEFVFQAGDLNFHSTSYDWLVVNQNDTNAQFKGSGTINGQGSYRFMIWAGDKNPDTFRIKIWEEIDGTEDIVYDNGFDQELGGGSIVIHKN